MEVIIIKDKIYEIRGQRVMLDSDLAALYGVPTKVFNQAVKRNIERFPEDFMFSITDEEWMGSQSVTASKNPLYIQVSDSQETRNGREIVSNTNNVMWSQIVTTSPTEKRRKSNLPYAFTEHGVTMLASVLRSEQAVKMSIEVVRAFIALKQLAQRQNSVDAKLQQIEDRLGEHDVQLTAIGDCAVGLDLKCSPLAQTFNDWPSADRPVVSPVPSKTSWMKRLRKENGRIGKGLDSKNGEKNNYYCAAACRFMIVSMRRMIVVFIVAAKLRGSWLSTWLMASYSSGSSCLNCTAFSKNTSMATAQNS